MCDYCARCFNMTGRYLKQLLKKGRMKQADIVKLTGISKPVVCRELTENKPMKRIWVSFIWSLLPNKVKTDEAAVELVRLYLGDNDLWSRRYPPYFSRLYLWDPLCEAMKTDQSMCQKILLRR